MSSQVKSNSTRRIIIIVAVVLFILIAVYFGIGAFAANMISIPDEHTEYFDTPADFGIEYQEVTFPAREDGLQIAAWYLPNPNADKAIIIVHGRNANKQWAASGTIVALQADLYNAGYTVLAIDMRGHGDSEGERYSYGVYERRDVLGAVDFLLSHDFAPGDIGVIGISLGGAAVYGAMAESDAIGAVVTEGTFADVNPLIDEQWKNESGLPMFFMPSVMLMNRLMFGYNLRDVIPANDISAAAPRPMLVMHCSEDDLVPVWHAEQLLQAAPQAESWIVDNCEHGEMHRDYPDEYSRRVIEFFNENL